MTGQETLSIDDALRRGIACHQAGRLGEAEQWYRAVIGAVPHHPDAQHNLGVVALQSGHAGPAVDHFQVALQANPALPQYWLSYAEALAMLNRKIEARNALQTAQDGGLRGVGIDSLAIRLNWLTSDERGRLVELLTAGRWDEGEALARGLTSLRHMDPDGWNFLSGFLQARHQIEEAAIVMARAVALSPDRAGSYNNLGNILLQAAWLESATIVFLHGLKLNPAHDRINYNFGNLLQHLSRLDDAALSYRREVALLPGLTDAYNNLGNTLRVAGHFEDAVAVVSRAVTLVPQDGYSHCNRALALLCTGQWRAGWREMDWLWQVSGAANSWQEFRCPVWQGEAAAARTILVYAEQGFGDTIQFCRYVPPLANLGFRVLLEVQSQLKGLLSDLPGVSQLIVQGDKRPHFDVHCPLLRLPLVLGASVDDIAAPLPLPSVCRSSNRTDRKFSVGLVWRGNPHHINDRNRSASATLFARMTDLPGIDWVSLQLDATSDEMATFPHLSHPLHGVTEWMASAQTLEAIDLVVTVDTSTAHLAGTLGKPTFLLLPYSADWRWRQVGAETLWYPSMRIFRQPYPGDWLSVIMDVRTAIGTAAGQI